MISKELLSEVLGLIEEDEKVTNIHCYDDFISYSTNYEEENINIHELAHKCKEWARDKEYLLKTSIYRDYQFRKKSYVYVCESVDNKLRWEARSEVEVVFQACEWILNDS